MRVKTGRTNRPSVFTAHKLALEENGMKDYQKVFLLGGTLFGGAMGLFIGIMNNLRVGLIGGLCAGVIFGSLGSGFAYIQTKNFKKYGSEIVGNENTIFSGGANHFMGSEGVGGWLFLTANELIFKSHDFNKQNHQLAIPLNQITGVKASFTLGFIPNGLKISTNGNIEKFVVFRRKEWIRQICEAVALKNRNNQRVGTLG